MKSNCDWASDSPEAELGVGSPDEDEREVEMWLLHVARRN